MCMSDCVYVHTSVFTYDKHVSVHGGQHVLANVCECTNVCVCEGVVQLFYLRHLASRSDLDSCVGPEVWLNPQAVLKLRCLV